MALKIGTETRKLLDARVRGILDLSRPTERELFVKSGGVSFSARLLSGSLAGSSGFKMTAPQARFMNRGGQPLFTALSSVQNAAMQAKKNPVPLAMIQASLAKIEDPYTGRMPAELGVEIMGNAGKILRDEALPSPLAVAGFGLSWFWPFRKVPAVTEPSPARKESTAYDWHKLVRQGFVPIVMAVLQAIAAKGFYDSYSAMVNDPETKPMFSRYSRLIYLPGNLVGKIFKKIFGTAGEINDPETLKRSASQYLQISQQGGQALNVVWFLANITALVKCLNSGCDKPKTAVVVADIGKVGLNILSSQFSIKGLSEYRSGNLEGAYSLFRMSQHVTMGTGFLQIISGLLRYFVETYDYAATGKADGSARTQAFQDVVGGVGQIVKSRVLLASAGGASGIAAKSEVMAFWAMSYPVPILYYLSAAGATGAAIGVATNTDLLFNVLMGRGRGLTHEQFVSNVVSCSTNIASNLAFFTAALLVNPSWATGALLASVTGLLLTAAGEVFQYYYHHQE